jgi:predicted HAD superfamily phosphohydrolase
MNNEEIVREDIDARLFGIATTEKDEIVSLISEVFSKISSEDYDKMCNLFYL